MRYIITLNRIPHLVTVEAESEHEAIVLAMKYNANLPLDAVTGVVQDGSREFATIARCICHFVSQTKGLGQGWYWGTSWDSYYIKVLEDTIERLKKEKAMSTKSMKFWSAVLAGIIVAYFLFAMFHPLWWTGGY